MIQMIQQNNSVYPLLANLEMYSKDTYIHSIHVAEIAFYLARRLDINTTGIEMIIMGALLHDVGKICIPKRILNKPEPLSKKEWAGIRMHPQISYLLVKGKFHFQVEEICRLHHKKLDGSGYPEGTAKIPLFCQIVTVADMYEAMITERSYKAAISHQEAIKQLEIEVIKGKINKTAVDIIRGASITR